MRLHVTGDVEGAARRYQALLQEQPDNPAIIDALGSAALQGGHAQQALTLFAEAARIDPGNARYLQHLAQAQRQSGALRAAIGTLEQAQALAPENQELFEAFIRACIDGGCFLDAENAVRARIEAAPYEMHWRKLLVFLYESQEKHSAALPHLEVLYRADEDQPEAFFLNYAASLYDVGRKEEAHAVVDAGLARYPGSPALSELKTVMA